MRQSDEHPNPTMRYACDTLDYRLCHRYSITLYVASNTSESTGLALSCAAVRHARNLNISAPDLRLRKRRIGFSLMMARTGSVLHCSAAFLLLLCNLAEAKSSELKTCFEPRCVLGRNARGAQVLEL